MVVLALLAGGAVAGCEPEPPRLVVENPGVFIGLAEPGSFYEYLDAAGNPTDRSFFDVGNPMCANGIDDDANERLDGVQHYDGSCLATTVEETAGSSSTPPTRTLSRSRSA